MKHRKEIQLGPRPLRGWLASLGIVGGVTLAIVLTTYPLVRESISGTIATKPPGCLYCGNQVGVGPTESLPNGVTITIIWSVVSGYAQSFVATDSSYAPVCLVRAPQGTCSFLSTGGNYTLSVVPNLDTNQSGYWVNFTIEWQAPLL